MTPVADGLASMFQLMCAQAPFLGITITLGAYVASTKLYRAMGSPIFVHPLLIAIAAIAVCLKLMSLPYEVYFESAEPLHLLLGPVVVLLAVPLWRQLNAIWDLGPKLVLVLVIGAVTGIVTSAGIALLFAAPAELVSTLAPKSVTTAVAINLSESLGGIPAITAVVVILTGLVGATFGWPVLHAVGIRDPRAKGFAIGVASHVIGTARVFQIDQKAGAFSSLGMILNALMTAALIGVARISLSNA
jgi:predicted murein hydrolase (TIGR00659 family)